MISALLRRLFTAVTIIIQLHSAFGKELQGDCPKISMSG